MTIDFNYRKVAKAKVCLPWLVHALDFDSIRLKSNLGFK
ncbi:hypothetical protein UF75_3409 [Desulfosporosinus sp. I2]|nr:hypothetical protein UF75_3409 [Desulfosporosinus sp. I2]